MEIRRLKVHVVLIAFGAFLVLGLLGQNFLHQRQVVQPMMEQVAAVDGVQEAALSRGRRGGVVRIFLDDNADLAETISAVQHILRSYGSGYVLELLDNPTPDARRALQEMMFVIEEAVVQGNFREMETLLHEIAEDFGQELVLSLDRSYIYLQLNDGTGQLIRAISRGDAAPVRTLDASEVNS